MRIRVNGKEEEYTEHQLRILGVVVWAYNLYQQEALTLLQVSQAFGKLSPLTTPDCLYRRAVFEHARDERGEMEVKPRQVFPRAFQSLPGGPVEVITTQGELHFRLADTKLATEIAHMLGWTNGEDR